MENAYAVIMAGGKGERLWPLSTPERPKQFLRLLGDRSMLQETVARVSPVVPAERILVVTSTEHVGLVREQLPEIPEENIVPEPVGRGTATCVALAAFAVQSRAPDGVMLALPADHVIAAPKRFRALLSAAIQVAAEGTHLVTFGIPPDRPETGYGYIQAVEPWQGNRQPGTIDVLCVERFTEKPDLETARQFVDEGTYYWNSGMFIWRTDTVLEEIQQHMPDLHRALAVLPPRFGDRDFHTCLAETYDRLPSQSIDRGVMEKSDRILLIPARDIGWNDVGGWEALRDVLSYRDKPWGHEHLWALNEHYAGKFLHINGGESLSLQYHEIKDETIHVVEGKLLLRIGETEDSLEERILSPRDSCDIPPRTVHQMEALEDCVIAEVSTPHLDDVVRLRDRYGREDATPGPDDR